MKSDRLGASLFVAGIIASSIGAVVSAVDGNWMAALWAAIAGGNALAGFYGYRAFLLARERADRLARLPRP